MISTIIIIASILVGLLSLFIGSRKVTKKRVRIISWIIFIISIGILTLQVINDNYKQIEQNKLITSGRIWGKELHEGEYPAIIIGGFKDTLPDPNTPFLSNICGVKENGVYITKKDGELKISTIITNKNGLKIGEIRENEWVVKPLTYFDRNFDEKGFEVIDENNDVILQLNVTNEGIEFAAKYYCPDGTKMAFGPKENGNAFFEIEGIGADLNSAYNPLFKYPSYIHLGERIN